MIYPWIKYLWFCPLCSTRCCCCGMCGRTRCATSPPHQRNPWPVIGQLTMILHSHWLMLLFKKPRIVFESERYVRIQAADWITETFSKLWLVVAIHLDPCLLSRQPKWHNNGTDLSASKLHTKLEYNNLIQSANFLLCVMSTHYTNIIFFGNCQAQFCPVQIANNHPLINLTLYVYFMSFDWALQ